MSLLLIAGVGVGLACCEPQAQEAVIQKDGSFYAVPYHQYADPRGKVFGDLIQRAKAEQSRIDSRKTNLLTPLTIKVRGASNEKR